MKKKKETQYLYEITKKGEWKCLNCMSLIKAKEELEMHHNHCERGD